MAIIYGTAPDAAVIEAFESTDRRVERWIDIYEADNVTPWLMRAPFISGSVSVDMSRSERRNFEVELADVHPGQEGDRNAGEIPYGPGFFWYDKILKPYRGIILPSGDTWAAQLGEFLIDNISRPRWPNNLSASCRDFTKKLMQAKFAQTTSFASGANVGTVINAIASNGGIVKFNFPTITAVLTEPINFERGSERWQAIQKLAEKISYEVFFDGRGYLTLRPFVDPLTAPLSYTFKHGVTDANIVDFTRSTNDNMVFNHVVVFGNNPSAPLVWAEAENVAPSSPTRIAQLGRRTYTRTSPLLSNNTEALALASSILKVSALEQFDMSMDTFVLPWLEAGEAVEVDVSDAAPGDPTRYLLTNFSIPLDLSNMDGTAKRVTIVG